LGEVFFSMAGKAGRIFSENVLRQLITYSWAILAILAIAALLALSGVFNAG